MVKRELNAKVFAMRIVSKPLTPEESVRDWYRKRELRGYYQVLSGRSCRLVFTNRDVLDFFARNFPSAEDLFDHPNGPRSSKAKLIQKMFRMNRLYARRRRVQVTGD